MQKKVVKVEFALYKDIDKVMRMVTRANKSFDIAARLDNEIDKEIKHFEKTLSQAEKIKNDFIKKAKEINVEYKGTENYSNLEEIINICKSNISMLDEGLRLTNSLMNKLRTI